MGNDATEWRNSKAFALGACELMHAEGGKKCCPLTVLLCPLALNVQVV